MDASRFDALAKVVARPFSRRTALKGLSGSGTAALAMGIPGTTARVTSEAQTPEDRTPFLFVQVFAAGTLVPKDGEPGLFTLTLDHGVAQTIYFSDRPERVVGTLPTVRFLDALGFTPDDPPNAALVTQTEAGADVVVLELFNPVYTESFGPDGGVMLTYDVKVLADYEGEGLAHLAAQQVDDALPTSFGTASLFIDDCDDQVIWCIHHGDFVGNLGSHHFCWSLGDFCCRPCEGGDHIYWGAACNGTFPACQGECVARGNANCW